MPEIVQETSDLNRSEKQPEVPKKFSKLRLFQILGLLTCTFNNETLKFEPSWSLRVLFYISLLSKPLFEIKLFVSNFFPRNSPVQLLIGNLFNYTPPQAKMFIGIVVGIERILSN